MRRPNYRHELEGIDPVTLLVISLALLMLSIMTIRAIGVAMTV
jgi:hypothetical protein